MSFAGNKGRMQARNLAARRRLRPQKRNKGDSDRAKRIRERMERREQKWRAARRASFEDYGKSTLYRAVVFPVGQIRRYC